MEKAVKYLVLGVSVSIIFILFVWGADPYINGSDSIVGDAFLVGEIAVCTKMILDKK